MGATISAIIDAFFCVITFGLLCNRSSSSSSSGGTGPAGWYLSELGESCISLCDRSSVHSCHAFGTSWLNSALKVELFVTKVLQNSIDLDCSESFDGHVAEDPSYDPNTAECFYWDSSYGTIDCSGFNSDYQRFCCCATEYTDCPP